MKKKVCHVTSSHNRYDTRIFEKEATSLTEKYDVTLLCADNIQEEIKNNVKIKSVVSSNIGKLNRFIINPIKLKEMCLKEDADIYHFHDPELIFLAKYIKKRGKKVIYDSHEDNVNRLNDRKWIPKALRPILKNIYAFVEKKVLRKLDAVIAVTDYIYDRLVKINSNTYVITNYPIIYENKTSKSNNNKTLCFAGGIKKYYMHHNVIKAIEDLDVVYKMAGRVFDHYLEELKELPSFNKVKYLGFLDRRKIKEIYLNSDIGISIIDYTPNMNYHHGSMGVNKIFEYMEAGLPVIATDFEIWDFVAKEKCGILVNPNNIDEIKEAIMYLISHPEEAYQMGQNGRKLVEERFNWNTQKKVLFKVYEEL